MHLKSSLLNALPKSVKKPQKACIYLLPLILCGSIFEASAADWTSISKTKQAEVMVDMDSYNETDGLPYISTKTLFVQPQNYRKNTLKFSYRESHTTSQFNCTQHTVKHSATQFFDQNNNLNKKLVGNEKGDDVFKPVVIGSKDAALESLVCQVHKMVGGN